MLVYFTLHAPLGEITLVFTISFSAMRWDRLTSNCLSKSRWLPEGELVSGSFPVSIGLSSFSM